MQTQPSYAGLASLVQSRGRGDDKMLVHMTPEEVHGLHALALASGGQISVNPDTGLYEFGWLSKLLPTLIGFALAPLTAGTSLAFLGSPLGAGLAVGGVEALRTGDLGKGLMAGLGAYGGAGLGSAFGAAGSVAGGAGQAGITAAGETAASEAAKQGAEQAAIEAAKKKAMEEATRKAIADQAAQKGIGSWANIKAGASNLFSAKPGIGALSGMDAFGGTMGALNLPAKAGLTMTAANALSPDMEDMNAPYQIDDSYYQSYGYDPQQGRFLGGQWRKGYPGFPGTGGGPGYAEGGTIPRPNPSYPQANITQSNYAAPFQYNQPQELLDGYEPKINPFTGEERFDNGGLTSLPKDTGPVDIFGAQLGSPAGESMMRRPTDPGRADPTGTPPPSLKDYYQSLLAPPQPKPSNAAFMDYLSGFNRFVTSPVVAPKPAAAPPTSGTTGGTGGTGGTTGGTGGTTGSTGTLPTFTYNPFSGEPMDLSSILGLSAGADGRKVYDREAGKFVNPTAPTAPTTPTTPSEPSFGLGDLALRGFGGFGGFGFSAGGSTEYAAGGKFLRGPGDGMSDDIKANISGRQEARLADGEFVVPADVVSHLGNGSSEAGARKLYKMMDNVRTARTGRKHQAPAVKTEKYLPK